MSILKSLPTKLALLTLALFIGQMLPAQGPERGRASHEARFEKLKVELGLTEVQSEQLKTLQKQHHEERRNLRQSDQELGPEQRKAMRKQHEAELSKILSQEQMEKMKEMRPKRERHGEGGDMQGHRGKERKEAFKAMKPLIMEQRIAFEEALSESDKLLIADLRARRSALKPHLKAVRKDMKAVRQQGEAPSAEAKAEMKPLKEEKRAIGEATMEIASRYQSELEAVHAALKPEMEKLRSEKEERKGEACEEKCERKGKKGKHAGRQGHRQEHQAVRFILMDPNGKGAEVAEAAELGIYPNPASVQSTLTYEVPVSGQVRVDLLSKSGQVLRTVYEGEQDAGQYDLDVNVSNLGTDIYYYRVTASDRIQTKRFSIVK